MHHLPVSPYNRSFSVYKPNDSNKGTSSAALSYVLCNANNGLAAWISHMRNFSVGLIISDCPACLVARPGPLGDKCSTTCTVPRSARLLCFIAGWGQGHRALCPKVGKCPCLPIRCMWDTQVPWELEDLAGDIRGIQFTVVRSWRERSPCTTAAGASLHPWTLPWLELRLLLVQAVMHAFFCSPSAGVQSWSCSRCQWVRGLGWPCLAVRTARTGAVEQRSLSYTLGRPTFSGSATFLGSPTAAFWGEG